MRGPPVVLTNTLGRPVTNVISERGAVPMTVVNTLGEPVTLVNSGGEPVTLFNPNGTLWDYPFSLFANNEQGAWYDPSDFSTLYQNSTGTTPVTAVEQPVGLMLDRSRGLVLGAELVVSPYTGATSGTWAVGATSITRNSSAGGQASINLSAAISTSKWYQVQFTVSNLSGDTFFYRVSAGTAYQVTADGTYIARVPGGGTSSTFVFAPWAGTAGEVTISNISVRELPGTHALQATSASRPVLRARYNQLTYSEQFDNAAWGKTAAGTGLAPVVTANAAVAPDGTMTADQVVFNLNGGTTNPDISVLQQQLSSTINAVTGSFYVRASSNVRIAARASTTWRAIDVTTTWQRIVLPSDAAGNIQIGLRGSVVSGLPDTATVELWGAQILTAADQTATGGAYQRIAAATDYDVSNPVWRPYLAFDGTDDGMATSSIDFSGTDEMTVFAGVTKLSDAAVAIVMSYNGTSNASAEMFAPRTTGANGDFAFSHRTTTVQEAGAATVVLSPATAVLTGASDISAPSVQLRRNGAVVQTVTTAVDANNYTSGTIRIGHRSSNLYLNGRLYSLAVLGRTATAAELSAMEAWMAGKTGVTL